MTSSITKNLMCIQMRSGVELWMEKDRVETLQKILENITGSKFINFDDKTINTADIVGIFNAEDMADYTRRKNGQWKCQSNAWHERGVKCECASLEEKQFAEERADAIGNCPICTNGFVKVGNGGVIECECVKKVKEKFNIK